MENTLPRKTLRLNPQLCTGCRLCEMVCSLQHEHECSTEGSRVRIIRDEEFGNHRIEVCIHCGEVWCIASCPTGALVRTESSGIVCVNTELCNGCGECVKACPFKGIIQNRKDNTVIKCDLCGGDPECVKVCFPKALELNSEK